MHAETASMPECRHQLWRHTVWRRGGGRNNARRCRWRLRLTIDDAGDLPGPGVTTGAPTLKCYGALPAPSSVPLPLSSQSPMFRTIDSNELPNARRLTLDKGSLWRAVDVVGRGPWMLATIADAASGGARRTVSIAWDNDLAELLKRPGAPELVQLLCLVPDEHGAWAVRNISEIFEGDAGGGTCYVLRCANGQEVCADLERTDPMLVTNRQLIACVSLPNK